MIDEHDNEFIDIKYVAKAWESILGADRFYVGLGSIDYVWDEVNNDHPELQNKVVTAMRCTRVPFAIASANNETLNITLEFLGKTITDGEKAEIMNQIKRILGTTNGTINVGERKYLFSAFFQQDKPMLAPQIHGGDWASTFNVSGTMLLSLPQGAIVSNRITTFIDGQEIKTLGFQGDMQKQAETPVKLNHSVPSMASKSQTATYTLQALLEDNEVCNGITRDIHLINASDVLNKVYTLKRVYPAFAIEKRCAVLGGQLIENAGAYAQFILNLQEIGG